MPKYEFGSREAANDFRDRIPEDLAPEDSRRSKTVRIAETAPRRIKERARDTALRSGGQQDAQTADMAELTDAEKQTLKRTTSFDWQRHGFEAMRAKAVLQREGVTEWLDYYEPGESAQSSLSKLQDKRQRAMNTRASIGIESDRTDQAEVTGGRRQRQQAEQARGRELERAKDAGLTQRDGEALDFLAEERQFTDDLFDFSFGEDQFGVPDATGADAQRLEEFHDTQRSERSRTMDEMRAADVTRDPFEWLEAPDEHDFPGIDTPNVEMIHEQRSERAQTLDEQRTAEIADDYVQWMNNPDRYDLPGVDDGR
jgi:hypothetical protein